jgi:hypothetical protein
MQNTNKLTGITAFQWNAKSIIVRVNENEEKLKRQA